MFSIFKNTKKLKISDDSGFLAIVNANTYKTYVDEDWQLDQLMEHFVDEMNNRNIIFWATGNANEYTVSFVEKPSNKIAFREFTSTINVNDDKLYLTNFEDLTMSAQFEDTKIPSEHHSELKIKLENGLYNFTVRQLFDPEDYDYEAEGKVNFEIVMSKTDKETVKINEIYWQTE